MSKGLQIAIGASAVVALVAWFAASELQEGTFRYFQTLDELRAEGTVGTPARVHGFVVPGSIRREVDQKRVHFAVQSEPPHATGAADETLAVVYESLETPDLFRDGAEVVVEGRLAARGEVFQATNVLAKCPSKFEGRVADAAAL